MHCLTRRGGGGFEQIPGATHWASGIRDWWGRWKWTSII